MKLHAHTLPLLSTLSLAVVSLTGCGDSLLPSLDGGGCGLTCPADGILQGNASISGITSLDGFFAAVIDVRYAGLNVSGKMRAELEAMALSLGVDTELSTDDLALAVKAAIETKLAANVDGALTITYQPPECSASLEVAANAAAECDVGVEPGSVSASCEGSCAIDASAQADCRAEGMLTCSGTAPGLACSGTCSGACELDAAAACSGTCNGTCSGECSVCTGGQCENDGQGNITNCEGTCSADCTGSCELSAGGTCGGRCTGTCEWDPGTADCEATAEAHCEASADASVECSGSCQGEVVPPEVSAECEAQVEAKANASVECTPPSLQVEFQFAASVAGDAVAQAEFKAWLNGFKLNFAGMLGAGAEIEYVALAATGLITAAGDAVSNVAGDIAGNGGFSLQATIGAGCALDELPNVGAALDDTQGSITDSASALATISSAVGG